MAAKVEPRPIEFAEIEQAFTVEAEPRSTRPAVYAFQDYIWVTVRTNHGDDEVPLPHYDRFQCQHDGLIVAAPRGHAKDYRPGRIVDLIDVLRRYAPPTFWHECMCPVDFPDLVLVSYCPTHGMQARIDEVLRKMADCGCEACKLNIARAAKPERADEAYFDRAEVLNA